MASEHGKRQWKSGNEHSQDKHAGVTAVLARAAYDRGYRARLLSRNQEVARAAFNEEGGFESLPPDFNLTCWQRAGTDDTSTDNVVVLLLPAPYELPPGGEPTKPDVSQYWQCTYIPYLEG